MYHLIVRAKLRRIFAGLNQSGNWSRIVDDLAPNFVHRFAGESAISGSRTSRESMEAWWQRLFRLFPQAQFEPREILVTGWPWNTRVAVHATIRATLSGGERYENEFVQLMHLRWGKITSIVAVEDTQRLALALSRLAATGVREAMAPPITKF